MKFFILLALLCILAKGMEAILRVRRHIEAVERWFDKDDKDFLGKHVEDNQCHCTICESHPPKVTDNRFQPYL